MMFQFTRGGIFGAVCCLAMLTAVFGFQAGASCEAAEAHGGLCVYLGDGDGKQAVGLAQGKDFEAVKGRPFLVHWLDNDASRVAQAREFVDSQGLYGTVSVECWTENKLPYVDNLVNLIVTDGGMEIPREELLRVLCPEGIAYIKQGDAYTEIRKQTPEGMDEWTHQWHGPDGALVSDDKLVGVPTGVQWLNGPLFAMKGRKNSLQSMVSANGRNFYLTQNVESNLGRDAMPQYLVARDAFNGLLLWTRPWTGPFVTGSGETSSRIVAVEDRLYIVEHDGVSALDGATGETVGTYSTAELPDKLLFSDGTLLLQSPAALVALDPDSAQQRWTYPASGASGAVVSDGRVFFLIGGRAQDGRWQFDVTCLDLATGQENWRVNTKDWTIGRLLRINFAKDGYVALQSHGALHLLSAEDGKRLWTHTTESRPGKDYADERFVGHFYRNGLVWVRSRSRESRGLQSLEEQASALLPFIELRDLTTGQSGKKLRGHTGEITGVAYSPDGSLFATASEDKTVILWNARSGREQARFSHADEVTAIAFAPDGKTLASAGDDKTIKLWDVGTRQECLTLEGHTDDVNSVAFSPDSKFLASASDDQTVNVWEVATGKIRISIPAHEDDINAVAFSPGGATLASASNDGTVKIWDAATGTLRQTLEGHSDDVDCVAFSRDGKMLASGCEETIALWDVATGERRATLEGNDDVVFLAFLPDGETLASGDEDPSIMLWNVKTGTPQNTIEDHAGEITSVAISPQTNAVAVAQTPGHDVRYSDEGSKIDVRNIPDGQLMWLGVDPATGKIVQELQSQGDWPESDNFGKMGCQLMVAVEDFIIVTRQTTFIDFNSGEKSPASFYRGGCGLGAVPANGLLYTHPHACGCFHEALRGLMAINSRSIPGDVEASETLARFEQGPAFGSDTANKHTASSDETGAAEWPMYRHDARRSGSTKAEVPGRLQPRWAVQFETPTSRSAQEWKLRVGNVVTSPVIADGKAFVAVPDAHRVMCLEAETGSSLWQFTAGGRIDTPPTIHDGLCLFGSHDGWVYCLRSNDGALVWRFRAASVAHRMVAYGQVESVSPVAGTVLVQNDVAYVVAGRAAEADGGIHVYAIEPHTGRVLWNETLSQEVYGLRDYVIGDGENVYLSNWQFDPQTGRKQQRNERGDYLRGGKVGLLEASWTRVQLALRKHIQEWTVGEAAGQLLAFSPESTFGYRAHEDDEQAPGELFAQGAQSWSHTVPAPAQVEAMLLANNVLFVAGPKHRDDREQGGVLRSLHPETGEEIGQVQLPASPVLDGMAAAYGRLYVVTEDGQLICLAGREE